MSSLLDGVTSFITRLDPYTCAGILTATFLAYWTVNFLRIRWEFRGLYTISSVLPVFLMGWRMRLPHIPIIAPVRKMTLHNPFEKYEKAKSDLIAISEFMTPFPIYSTASPQVAHMICAKSNIFKKTVDTIRYSTPSVFGSQIISAQTGPDHRRHRGVVKGCFNEEIMNTAWNCMATATQTMLREEGLEDGGIMRGVKTMMIKATLLVIGKAAFNQDFPWNIPSSNGPTLPFDEALHWVEENLVPIVVFPKWLIRYSPSSYLRRVYKARTSLEHHITTLVKERRDKLKTERARLNAGEKSRPPTDILGALVAGQMDAEQEARLNKSGSEEDRKKIVGLSEDEVMSNIFVFILAGHETTGHTLTWVLGNLALYPDWQEKILAEIEEACGDADPTYRDINRFPLALAFAYETLRFRDLAMGQPKLVTEDTIIPYTTWDAQGNITNHSRLIQKGAYIMLDTPASQTNPYYWRDSNVFDPTRHLGTRAEAGDDDKEGKVFVASSGPSSPFMGFSSGVRVCIGKRFAEVEMVSILVYLLKRYRIKTVPLSPRETWDQIKERYLRCAEIVSLTPFYFEVELEKR